MDLVSYYEKFIKNYASIAAPLYEISEPKKKFICYECHDEAFKTLQDAINSNSVVYSYDPNLNIRLECDASKYGIGVVFSQQQSNGEWRQVRYASKKLSGSQLKLNSFGEGVLRDRMGYGTFYLLFGSKRI